MIDNEENIMFEQMPDFQLNWEQTAKTDTFAEEDVHEEVMEKEYDSLYDELLDKCNPSNFNIESFGLEKFNVALDFYAQLQDGVNGIPDEKLVSLRNRAIDELGIHISTMKKFESLVSRKNWDD